MITARNGIKFNLASNSANLNQTQNAERPKAADRLLTVLQRGHRLRLHAEDAVPDVVGGQHSELVGGERLQPADRGQALELAHTHTHTDPVLLIKEQQRWSVTGTILRPQPLVISPGSTESLSGTERTPPLSRSC